MVTINPNVYDETQFQNDAPIGPQPAIPEGVHDIELSWDRKRGYMRIIIDSQKWWFKELLGSAICTHADNR